MKPKKTSGRKSLHGNGFDRVTNFVTKFFRSSVLQVSFVPVHMIAETLNVDQPYPGIENIYTRIMALDLRAGKKRALRALTGGLKPPPRTPGFSLRPSAFVTWTHRWRNGNSNVALAGSASTPFLRCAQERGSGENQISTGRANFSTGLLTFERVIHA